MKDFFFNKVAGLEPSTLLRSYCQNSPFNIEWIWISEFLFPWNHQKTNCFLIMAGGKRYQLISLNSINIRSEIWQGSLKEPLVSLGISRKLFCETTTNRCCFWTDNNIYWKLTMFLPLTLNNFSKKALSPLFKLWKCLLILTEQQIHAQSYG